MKYVILPVLLLSALAAGADVGVDSILAPVGTIDSDQVVTPRCIVANHVDSVSDVRAHFGVFDAGGPIYLDSLTVPGMASGAEDTVEFTGWVPGARDSLTAMAWTTCAEDTNPANDTCRVRFFVRVIDIALTELIQPHDTLDSGAAVFPACRAWNYGNQTLNFDVEFRIGPYLSTRTLTLPGGGSTVVSAPEPWRCFPGIWIIRIEAIVPGDMHPENNVLEETLWVRGTIAHDAAVGPLVLDGPWPIHVGDTVIPGMSVRNYGSEPDSLWAYVIFRLLGGGQVYRESLHVLLPDTVDVHWFPAVVFPESGLYAGVDSVYLPGDQNSTNDAQLVLLEVLPEAGVEEVQPQTSFSRLRATVLRRLPAGAVAFDAMGRRVTNPRPGIYFVREPSAVSCRKVILQR